MFTETTATRKILDLTKRIRAITGGTSASKTISIMLVLIDMIQSDTSPGVTSVTSETMPHLKRGAIRDFLNIMQEHNYFNDKDWNKTDFIYDFGKGRLMEFFSLDMPHKVRGPRRKRLFINEANNISKETFDQLEVRTEELVFLDWNPVQEFWFYTDILGKREDVDFLTLTYKDNEALPPSIVQSIESRKNNANWWRVYGEGQLGLAENIIYPHFKMIDTVPEEAKLVRKGLDFGYTNDPSALLDIYQWNNAYIWDELLYQKGLSNKQIADVILNSTKALTVGDSAEPKSIDELSSYSVAIIPAQKGPGSVLQGIQYVQEQNIFVTKRSVNIWKEQRNYLWLTDKDGRIINEPSPIFNHLMDAGRYGMESLKPVDSGLISKIREHNQSKINSWRI